MTRLRFAPSPTGFLHVGGLRTALFSWLYARANKGSFIFRLEDTDRQRFVEGAESDLMQMLKWAGLDIDEGPGIGGDYGPYRQSERVRTYLKYARMLVERGCAYPCFCSPERLQKIKTEQRSRGETARYDRHCRSISPDAAGKRVGSGETHVIRMKIPEQEETLRIKDLVRGTVAIESSQAEDQVMIKSDGFPTYHLAVVVDDHLMKITHVVRGEEWLPSFPKHLLLYRYFGWDPPQFAHLPLILNPDRGKLSKRQGDVAVEDFRDRGYLPEALLNFIALLGWGPEDDRELFSPAELVEHFSLERINRSGAVFDRDKLKWMNQQYIQQLDPQDLFRRLQPHLEKSAYRGENPEALRRAVEILQPRLTTLEEIGNRLSLFFEKKPVVTDAEALAVLRKEESRTVLQEFIAQAEPAESLNAENFAGVVKAVQKKTGIKGRALWMPLRCAVTLETQGPDLPLIVGLFGKEKCLRMMKRALEI